MSRRKSRSGKVQRVIAMHSDNISKRWTKKAGEGHVVCMTRIHYYIYKVLIDSMIFSTASLKDCFASITLLALSWILFMIWSCASVGLWVEERASSICYFTASLTMHSNPELERTRNIIGNGKAFELLSVSVALFSKLKKANFSTDKFKNLLFIIRI